VDDVVVQLGVDDRLERFGDLIACGHTRRIEKRPPGPEGPGG
jgi:hypothetical protein